MSRYIDADKLRTWFESHSVWDEFTVGYIMGLIDEQPTVDAISISFIEEQIKECEKYDYPNTAKIFTALIKMWDNVKAEWERKEE